MKRFIDFINEEKGDCFNAAYQHLKKNPSHTLVHAEVTSGDNTFPHAWTEEGDKVHEKSNKQNIIVNKDDYYKEFKPTNIKKYSLHQALVTSVRQRHYGPWD